MCECFRKSVPSFTRCTKCIDIKSKETHMIESENISTVHRKMLKEEMHVPVTKN